MNAHQPEARRLSAIVVNDQSGTSALTCVESLRREWNRTRRLGLDLEVVCIDLPGARDQAWELTGLRQRGARVLHAEAGSSYADAVRTALSWTSGAQGDIVALIDPDVVFLPGSIDPLMDTLVAEPRCGAVGPRAHLDFACQFELPRPSLTTPAEHGRAMRARILPAWGRAHAARRHRRALEWWAASEPLATDALSRACLFVRRDVIHRIGGLFGASYSGYFEDAELCACVRAAGLDVVYQPESRIVRRWAHTDPMGLALEAEELAVYRTSRRAYLERFHGRLPAARVELLERVAGLWSEHRLDRGIHAFEDLGVLEAPPEVFVQGEFALELAAEPTFAAAAGMPFGSEGWTIAEEAWEWLLRGRYYARALETRQGRPTGVLFGAWTFVKTTPARTEAWQPGELARDFESAWPLEHMEAVLG